MGLREDAIAAADAAAADVAAAAAAARTARIAAARAVLDQVLAPTDVAGLEVVAELPVQVVLCGDGVCLAVRDQAVNGPRVTLVVGGGQEWTRRGDVTSLAQLGLLIAGADA